MKRGQERAVLKLFLLTIILQLSSFEVVNQTDVKEFIIERRGGGKYDLFMLNYKNGSYCIEDANKVNDWCNTLKASFDKTVTTNGKSCGCSCSYGFPTFLPSNQSCINGNQAQRLGGCSDYIRFNHWSQNNLLSKVVNLSVANSEKFVLSSSRDKCSVISGHFFDYNGFHGEWKSIHDQIFGFHQLKLQWKADKNGTLSGRIIRLNVTCYNTRSSHPRSPFTRCMLFKALGTVTYYAPSKTSSVHTVPTASSSHTPSSSYLSSPSLQLPQSTQTSSLSPMPQSSSLSPMPQSSSSPSPSPSLGATTQSTATHTGKFSSFVSTHIDTRSLQTMLALHSSGPILLSTSTAELESSLPVNSGEISNQVVNTGIPKSSVSTGEPNYSETSELPTTESSLPTRDVPGDKEARKGGKDKGVAIGAGVGGAVIFGIIVIGLIIVFCKRRKLRESTEKIEELHVGVKNPVYEKPQDDIQMERHGEKATTFSGKDSQPTYMELVDNRGHESYGAVYSTADENYDNSSVYQGLDKNTPAAPPVYQSLQNNQPSTKKPMPKQKISNAEKPEKPSVPSDPVYNVLEESHTKQGNTSEAIYNVLEGPDPGHDTSGNIQDPVYNVLDGPDAGQTYEAPDVGVQQDPLYNVLEVPESKQEHQEPLYNVLESADTESAPSRQDGSYDGAVSEPLYNVLDGADSSGANSSGAEYAAPNRHLSADGHDNPAYEQTLEFGALHALVHSPGSERESLYEPLKGSDRQDVYEPLHKKGK